MKIYLQIPNYNKNDGLNYHWEDNFLIKTKYANSEFLLEANKEGLVSLAIQLLTLAQDNVEPGTNLHYYRHGSLEDGSVSFVIDKI
ncbi:MAG: hypothetical protein JST32_00225 [Bacteroidetes bacterium]|nr:hypothetical protein [Bacteroidota bacterium]